MTSAGATATLAQWGSALSAVGYITSSSTPGTRTIEFAVNDGTKTSAPATDSVVVISPTELSSLTLSQGTLSPAFAQGTSSYSVTVPYTVASLDVTPTLSDPSSTLTVDGSVYASGNSVLVNLSVGTNPITIVVTAQGGTTKTYTLNATRVEAPTINLSASSSVVSRGQSVTVTGTVYDSSNNSPFTNSPVTLSATGGTLLQNGQTVTSAVYTDHQGRFQVNWQMPTTAGIYSLTASDGGGTQGYSIDVIAKPPGSTGGPSAPSIITDFFTEPGQVGQTYAEMIRELGGTFPLTWSVVNGTLPLGLKLDNQGNITGTPTTAGTYTFTAQVKDAYGRIARKQLTITIAAATSGTGSTGTSAPTPVTIRTPMVQTVMAGHALDIKLQATAGTAPYTWSVVGTLPDGLRMDQATGHITGTPQKTGVQQVEVEATDAQGVTSKATLTVDVLKSGERQVLWNGHIQNVPGIVGQDGGTQTTFMPIWYVMQWLQTMGMESTWNGLDWHLTSAMQTDLSNIRTGSGSRNIYLNRTLLQKVNTTAAVDPSAGRPTTYMPIWYVQQLLNRVGLTNTWNGMTWTVMQKNAN